MKTKQSKEVISHDVLIQSYYLLQQYLESSMPYLQSGGSHVHLLTPGDSLTRVAVPKLCAEIDRLNEELLSAEGAITMAVDRLGGKVEGRRTHEGNFLQRIDELRLIERRLRRKEGK